MRDSADRSRDAAATAVGQVFVLLGASLVAVVATATVAPERLDAYFTANQIAVVAVFLGQGLRTTVPGLAVGRVVSIRVLTRATAWLVGIAAVLALLAVAVAPELVPSRNRANTRQDLLILVPGALAQIAGGYAAGRVAMRGRFAGIAAAYSLGMLLNASILALFLTGERGWLLAPASLAGWVVSAGALLVLLARSRATEPSSAASDVEVTSRSALARIVLGIAPVLASQGVIVAAVTAGGATDPGGATVVSLALLALNAVATVAVAPIPVVLAAELGERWDRTVETLIPTLLAVVRLSAAIAAPLALVLVLVGHPVAVRVLHDFSPGQIDQLFHGVLLLLPTLPVTAASMVALVAVMAQDRLGHLARAVVSVLAGFVVCAVVLASAGAPLLVLIAATSAAAATIAGAILRVSLGAVFLRVVREAYAAAAVVAWPAGVLLAVGQAGGASSPAVGMSLAVAGIAVHGVWLWVRRPEEFQQLTRIVRR